MPDIQVDGRAVHYSAGGHEWAPGRPVALLLHGAGCDHTVWALQARALAHHGWNVAAPDLPGHGRSADAPALDSVDALADWAAGLLDALGAARAAVVGHSMGAAAALTLAAGRPGRVAALGLLGASGRMAVHPDLLRDTLADPPAAHRFIAAFSHGPAGHLGGARAPGVWLAGATLALLARCPPPVLHRDFAACEAWRGEPLAARVACPALVLSGAADRMTPARAGEALARAIPGARFEALPDIGHMMMAEAPGAVTAALRAFLAGAVRVPAGE